MVVVNTQGLFPVSYLLMAVRCVRLWVRRRVIVDLFRGEVIFCSFSRRILTFPLVS